MRKRLKSIGDGVGLEQYGYERDARGRITEFRLENVRRGYSYDGNDQLLTSPFRSYEYDDNFNRLGTGTQIGKDNRLRQNANTTPTLIRNQACCRGRSRYAQLRHWSDTLSMGYMIKHCFPTSWTTVQQWADDNGVRPDAATVRFIQFAVLDSVASDPLLWEILILRGAGALRLFYGGLRDTRDLDFLVLNLPGFPPESSDLENVKRRMNAILNRRLPEYFNGQERWDQWLAAIKIDLSRCEMVCECTPVTLSTLMPERFINVCALEEIVAEKMVAILNSSQRPKSRVQDLFDIATIIVAEPRIDRSTVAELGSSKAARWGCRLSSDSFTIQLRDRLAGDWGSLADATGSAFIPFETAWERVVDFVKAIGSSR